MNEGKRHASAWQGGFTAHISIKKNLYPKKSNCPSLSEGDINHKRSFQSGTEHYSAIKNKWIRSTSSSNMVQSPAMKILNVRPSDPASLPPTRCSTGRNYNTMHTRKRECSGQEGPGRPLRLTRERPQIFCLFKLQTVCTASCHKCEVYGASLLFSVSPVHRWKRTETGREGSQPTVKDSSSGEGSAPRRVLSCPTVGVLCKSAHSWAICALQHPAPQTVPTQPRSCRSQGLCCGRHPSKPGSIHPAQRDTTSLMLV